MEVWRCDLVPQFQSYETEIRQAMDRALMSGRYVLAEEVSAFELEFATYIGAKHCLGVNSGLDALVLALKIVGVGPGDHVVTTPFTAIPTYSAIRQLGAEAIFVDIDPKTWLMDIEKVSEVLSAKTKAILPVHIFGNAVNIPRLRDIVGPNIPIVEDCAQAHGASWNGQMVGTMGDISAFSFYPTKNLGGYGDGGMIATSNADWNRQLRQIRMYGMTS